MIVDVHEDITATLQADSPLWAEGKAMLDAVLADLGDRGRVWDGDARGKHVLLIAPETGGRLQQLAEGVIRDGGTLLGPSPEGIRLTADKLALARHWESQGVPTPATWLLGEHPPSDRPLVMKPRDGAGSQQTRLWSKREVVDGDFVVQEHVSGFAASVAFLIGPSRLVALPPCEQLLDGFSYVGGRVPIDPRLAERATAIATAAVSCVPGLRGYVGVDVVLGDDGRDWAIEINPRLTTSYVGLRRFVRGNLAEMMVAAWAGDAVDVGSRSEGVRFGIGLPQTSPPGPLSETERGSK